MNYCLSEFAVLVDPNTLLAGFDMDGSTPVGGSLERLFFNTCGLAGTAGPPGGLNDDGGDVMMEVVARRFTSVRLHHGRNRGRRRDPQGVDKLSKALQVGRGKLFYATVGNRLADDLRPLFTPTDAHSVSEGRSRKGLAGAR